MSGRAHVPKLPLRPSNPERICWGCDRCCPADAMACGSEVVRGMHPAELFGADWAAHDEALAAPGGPPVGCEVDDHP
jgi:hypothetical protein